MNLLENGLLNTLVASSPIRELQQKPLRDKLNKISTKQIFKSSNGQSIEVYGTDTYKKKVLFLPGWLGHKDSKYLIPLADLLYGEGFDAVRIHPVDHGDTEHMNREFFRATDIKTLIEVVQFFKKKYSDNEIHLIGFSLGGNIALRISAFSPINFLKNTVVISPVIDPEISMNAMDNTSWILKKYFVKKWQRTLKRKIKLYDIESAEEALKYKNLQGMTEFFTEHFSPHKDMKELFAGYAITQETIDNIKHNTFVYSAHDDPCVPIEPLQRLSQTDYVKFKPQKYGGHCGFIDDFKFSSALYEEIAKRLNS